MGQNTIPPHSPSSWCRSFTPKPIRMKPGSIVRCVDDTNWSKDVFHKFSVLPVKGELYTVRRIIANTETPDGPPGVALEEIHGTWDHFPTYFGIIEYEEYHFRMNRFKEVVPPHLFDDFIEALTKEPIKIKALNQ